MKLKKFKSIKYMKNLHILILSGGSGSRLWPLSNPKLPKQFIPIVKNKSLFELTLNRAKFLTKNPIIISSAKKHQSLIKPYENKMKNSMFKIFEEEGRNTAAAIWFGAKHSYEINPESIMLIMPSDHLILNNPLFKSTIYSSIKYLSTYKWILYGVKPSYPATGFGYIKSSGIKELNKIENFVEKPDLETAKKFLKKKNTYWNSGIFLGRTKSILNSLDTFCTDISKSADLAWEFKRKIKNSIFLKKEFLSKIRSDSIDKSVIEKEKNLGLQVLHNQWFDIGSWDNLAKIKGLILSKNKRCYEDESENNFIYSPNNLIVTSGIKNTIIVNVDGVTIIMKKGQSENLKEIIKKIKKSYNSH